MRARFAKVASSTRIVPGWAIADESSQRRNARRDTHVTDFRNVILRPGEKFRRVMGTECIIVTGLYDRQPCEHAFSSRKTDFALALWGYPTYWQTRRDPLFSSQCVCVCVSVPPSNKYYANSRGNAFPSYCRARGKVHGDCISAYSCRRLYEFCM